MFPFPYLLDIYSGFYLNLHINRAFSLDNIAFLTWMAARTFLRLKNFLLFFILVAFLRATFFPWE